MSESISLSVPYPPTSNHNTMVARGRRISSPKYRAWRTEAEKAIRDAANGWRANGHYCITYVVQRPDRRRRDLENLPKSISDALQAAGVIADDCHCLRSLITWAEAEPSKSARVLVHIHARAA